MELLGCYGEEPDESGAVEAHPYGENTPREANRELQEQEQIEKNLSLLSQERILAEMDEPSCPRLIQSIDLQQLLSKLRHEIAGKDASHEEDYLVVFRLPDEVTSAITRAIQEDQMLKTKLKVFRRNYVTDLPSFWDVWKTKPNLRKLILEARDPHEEKWSLSKKFGYKMATNFMPGYAKAIYEYFDRPAIVLDPCSGWGDRLLGAEVAGVEKYIGFDPNISLRPGYARIMSTCGHQPVSLTSSSLQFSNTFEIHSLPFEEGAPAHLSDNSIDFVFTSPPFFDYEMYTPQNPQYSNWLTEFYEPLFIQSARVVKPGGAVCVYIGDTSAGEIELFLRRRVMEICPLVLQQRSIGFSGIWSGYVRKIWVFRKVVVEERG
jgi:hypothetical protein